MFLYCVMSCSALATTRQEQKAAQPIRVRPLPSLTNWSQKPSRPLQYTPFAIKRYAGFSGGPQTFLDRQKQSGSRGRPSLTPISTGSRPFDCEPSVAFGTLVGIQPCLLDGMAANWVTRSACDGGDSA